MLNPSVVRKPLTQRAFVQVPCITYLYCVLISLLLLGNVPVAILRIVIVRWLSVRIIIVIKIVFENDCRLQVL